jgi:hypothetical protein
MHLRGIMRTAPASQDVCPGRPEDDRGVFRLRAMEAPMRDLVAGGGVAVVSWLCLAIGLGNVGLQRSVALGPLTLLESPMTLVLIATSTFGMAFVVAQTMAGLRPSRLIAVVLVADLVGALVLAPIAVGELRPSDAPVVFVVLTALGVQPVLAWLGAAYAGRRSGGDSPMA